MSDMENNVSSEKSTEKAEVLFEALQNVPEDLLGRSEKGSTVDKVIVFVKQHKQICAACVALAFVGLCFIGYQSVNGGMDNATSTAGPKEKYDVGMNDAAIMEEAEDITNNATGSVGGTEGATNDDVSVQESHPETALDKDVLEDVVQEAVGNMDTTKDLYAAYMPKDIPEGYEFESVSLSKGAQEEVLQVRLIQAEGQYIQLVVKRPLAGEKQETEVETPQDSASGAVAQPKNNVIEATDLTREAIAGMRTLIAESEEVNNFIVQYDDGVSIECEGSASAEDMYHVLAAYLSGEQEETAESVE